MIGTKTKRIFTKISYWKFIKQQLTDSSTGTFIGIILVVMVGTSPLAVVGMRNAKLDQVKQEWIETRVKDIHNKDFDWLDIEDEPPKLEPKTAYDRFKVEFEKSVGRNFRSR